MESKIDITCLIALVFIGASLYTSIKHCIPCDKLKESFTEEQLSVYTQIVKERLYNYYIGLIIGIILALVYYKYSKDNEINKTSSICVYLAIILSTQFIYYMLVPKSKYMLDYIDQEQIPLWLETYKNMKQNYYLGALFGIISYFILMYAYY